MALMRPNESSTESNQWDNIEHVFNALESPLLKYALQLTSDLNTAEDIVQEAFMRLHKQYEQVEDPRRWLYRSVHNLALNHLRDNRKIVPMPERSGAQALQEEPDPQPLPDQQIARWEGIGLVRLTLNGLDPKTRELVRLKFEEDLSYKDISAKTGLSVGNVGYLLHHALKAIGDELSRNGIAL